MPCNALMRTSEALIRLWGVKIPFPKGYDQRGLSSQTVAKAAWIWKHEVSVVDEILF